MSSKKPYCVAPWTSLYVDPGGIVFPCCVWQDKQQAAGKAKGFGNLNNNSLQEIYTSEEALRVKKLMLENKTIPECVHCVEQEKKSGKNSYRGYMNTNFGNLIKNYEKEDLKLALWDVRISNFCNFKCRGCTHLLSSAWYEDALILENIPGQGPVRSGNKALITLDDKDNFFNDLEPHFDYVEEVYFAGGEPLIMPEHYQILDKLIAKNKKVKLRYNTNLSVLDRQNKRLEEYWEFFDLVDVGVSIDGVYGIGEYIRKGFNHDKIISNIERLQAFIKKEREAGKESIIRYSVTIGILNIFHLFDFVNFLIDRKLINTFSHLQPNTLYWPTQLNMQILPPEAAEEFKEKLDSFDFSRIKDENTQKLTELFFYDAYEHLKVEKNFSENLGDFHQRTKTLDEIRDEKFLEVYKDSPLLKYVRQYWDN